MARLDVAYGQLLLEGLAEECDREGVLTLRPGDGVVLVDTTGEPPLGVVGRHVSFVPHNAEAFPTNL